MIIEPTEISMEDATLLERPISPEEGSLALSQMKVGLCKSPGLDGSTVQCYKMFLKQLLPHFLTAFNSFSEALPTAQSLLEAQVMVFAKPGKYPALASNYHPISLLNLDLKIYAKLLVNR